MLVKLPGAEAISVVPEPFFFLLDIRKFLGGERQTMPKNEQHFSAFSLVPVALAPLGSSWGNLPREPSAPAVLEFSPLPTSYWNCYLQQAKPWSYQKSMLLTSEQLMY